MKGLFVTGTDTNVGKTWVGAQLVSELIKFNLDVKVRKPIESGWPDITQLKETDAWKLANAACKTDDLDIICPNRFKAALSPDRAATLEKQEITSKQLKDDCLNQVTATDFLFVEGAGGFYSPISHDGLNADLAKAVQLPVLLVVEDRLGCINQALLNIEAIAKQGLYLCAIALNTSKVNQADSGMNNFEDIQKRVDCEVIPFSFKQTSNDSIKKLARVVLKSNST